MKVSVGRMVHYVDEHGLHNAAIVVDVDHHNDVVEVAVFPPTLCSMIPMYNRHASFSEEAVSGTWHWPEGVK